MLAFIFGARGVLTGAFQAVMVYTPEVSSLLKFDVARLEVIPALCYLCKAYPTSIRGLGFGFCSSVARIGAMITPFVAEVSLWVCV